MMHEGRALTPPPAHSKKPSPPRAFTAVSPMEYSQYHRQRERPQSSPTSPVNSRYHRRRPTTARLALTSAQIAWSGSKRPAQQWVNREAHQYGKPSSRLASPKPAPALVRLPSRINDEAYRIGVDVDDSRRRQSGVGGGNAAFRRWTQTNKENKATPGLLSLLQQLQPEEKKVELTEGGVPVPSMKAALRALPPGRKLAAEDASCAAAMEEALLAHAHTNDFLPNSRLPVGARLTRLEQRLNRELEPTNEVKRVTRILQLHREKLQDKFSEWDADGDGQITRGELVGAMLSLGLQVRQGEIDDFFAEFDPDGSGTLDLKEFYGVAYSGATHYSGGVRTGYGR